MMHAAKVENSPALQSILAFLRERGATGATTWEILERCRVGNPATEVSALRKNGFNIECKYQFTSGDRRKVYRYWIRETEPVQSEMF
jgi:hypothetical protein